ncbi:MAG: HAD-IA family hydrolase [Desulfobacterales bacterium]|jgi:putative hydrolase of the HAD superfamily
MIEAVFWDFGGVITTSPFEAFNKFECKHHLPQNFIRTINATNPDVNAWARFERSDITLEEFDREFEQETRFAGHPIRGIKVLELLGGDLRPEMVQALRRCHRNFRTACLTNTMKTGRGSDEQLTGKRTSEFEKVMELFDHVIASSDVGVRKPDPRFYEMACEIVEVAPGQVVFLDDLGINLKPARAMGMTTIKVTDPQIAIKDLEEVLGISLS